MRRANPRTISPPGSPVRGRPRGSVAPAPLSSRQRRPPGLRWPFPYAVPGGDWLTNPIVFDNDPAEQNAMSRMLRLAAGVVADLIGTRVAWQAQGMAEKLRAAVAATRKRLQKVQ
jgi:hypothetical protein